MRRVVDVVNYRRRPARQDVGRSHVTCGSAIRGLRRLPVNTSRLTGVTRALARDIDRGLVSHHHANAKTASG